MTSPAISVKYSLAFKIFSRVKLNQVTFAYTRTPFKEKWLKAPGTAQFVLDKAGHATIGYRRDNNDNASICQVFRATRYNKQHMFLPFFGQLVATVVANSQLWFQTNLSYKMYCNNCFILTEFQITQLKSIVQQPCIQQNKATSH